MQLFWNKVNKTDSCWNWIAGSRGNGYGAFKYKGKVIDAHRLSFMFTKGEIPDGLFVCHTCDNKKCVNPDHLFLGTHQDNMIDCYKKGRMYIPDGVKFGFGNIPKNRKINDERIFEIKAAIENRGKKSLAEIGRQFGVSRFVVSKILKGKIYRNTPTISIAA